MKLSKKHIVFILAVFLLIISVIYRVLNPFVQPRVDELTFTGEKQGNTEIKIKQNFLPGKKLQEENFVYRFLNKSQTSVKVYKDLFLIYQPPSNLGQNQNISLPVNKNIQNRQKKVEVRKDSIQQIKEYISSYRVYGVYKSKDTKAVFLSKNKLVLVAKTGDRLDGKYLIDDIQDNYIKIRALDLNETIRLEMREFNNEEP